MKRTIKIADSLKQAAGALRVPLWRVKAAKRAGSDAFVNGRVDLRRLRVWLREHPAPTVAPTSPPISSPTTAEQSGAPYALARLAGEEMRLHQIMIAAEQAGDIDGASRLRAEWVAVCEAMRKQDAALEEHKKEVGELIPRAHVERHLGSLSYWLNMVLRQLSQQAPQHLAGKEMAAQTEWLFNYGTVSLEAAIGAMATDSVAALPPWAVKALRSTTPFHSSPERVGKLADLLAEFLEGAYESSSAPAATPHNAE